MPCKSEMPNDPNCQNCPIKGIVRNGQISRQDATSFKLPIVNRPGSAWDGTSSKEVVYCGRKLATEVV
jgi:hypothetical protein